MLSRTLCCLSGRLTVWRQSHFKVQSEDDGKEKDKVVHLLCRQEGPIKKRRLPRSEGWIAWVPTQDGTGWNRYFRGSQSLGCCSHPTELAKWSHRTTVWSTNLTVFQFWKVWSTKVTQWAVRCPGLKTVRWFCVRVFDNGFQVSVPGINQTSEGAKQGWERDTKNLNRINAINKQSRPYTKILCIKEKNIFPPTSLNYSGCGTILLSDFTYSLPLDWSGFGIIPTHVGNNYLQSPGILLFTSSLYKGFWPQLIAAQMVSRTCTSLEALHSQVSFIWRLVDTAHINLLIVEIAQPPSLVVYLDSIWPISKTSWGLCHLYNYFEATVT